MEELPVSPSDFRQQFKYFSRGFFQIRGEHFPPSPRNNEKKCVPMPEFHGFIPL
jgi:hypothetical protein